MSKQVPGPKRWTQALVARLKYLDDKMINHEGRIGPHFVLEADALAWAIEIVLERGAVDRSLDCADEARVAIEKHDDWKEELTNRVAADLRRAKGGAQ